MLQRVGGKGVCVRIAIDLARLFSAMTEGSLVPKVRVEPLELRVTSGNRPISSSMEKQLRAQLCRDPEWVPSQTVSRKDILQPSAAAQNLLNLCVADDLAKLALRAQAAQNLPLSLSCYIVVSSLNCKEYVLIQSKFAQRINTALLRGCPSFAELALQHESSFARAWPLTWAAL